MENKRKKVVKVLILAGMTVCLIPVCQAYYQSKQHRMQQKILREMVTEASVQYTVQEDGATHENSALVLPGQAEEKPVMLAKYVGLYEENKDLAGWLSIEGMKIDYPVMQGEDDEYYLHHDFYGEDSKYGCLYVRGRADLDAGTNFYGNIKELSLYDTGVEARYGDTFLTLSTCAYHVPDGRLVVVAKRTA